MAITTSFPCQFHSLTVRQLYPPPALSRFTISLKYEVLCIIYRCWKSNKFRVILFSKALLALLLTFNNQSKTWLLTCCFLTNTSLVVENFVCSSSRIAYLRRRLWQYWVFKIYSLGVAPPCTHLSPWHWKEMLDVCNRYLAMGLYLCRYSTYMHGCWRDCWERISPESWK